MVLKVFHGNTLKLIGGLLSTVALLTMLSACGSTGGQSSSVLAPQQNSSTGSAGLNIVLHADKFEFTTPQQFCQTLVTAEIIVGSHGTSRWNTSDGKLPAGITKSVEVARNNLRVYTPVVFAHLTTLVDHRHITTQEFLTIGGQVGNDRYFVDDDPTLVGTGGHFIVVLFPSTPQTGGNTEVALVVGNAYPISAQGIVTLQQAGDPNEPGPGQVQPAITISLASLKQQLASCK